MIRRGSVAQLAAFALATSAVAAEPFFVRRMFRPPRHVRGNTNILKLQPIDRAAWIWTAEDDGCQFLKFRKRFSVGKGDGRLVFDVSADERFYLELDGKFVARGPNRSCVENWQYQTYETELSPGEHEMTATVWRTTDHGPLAQLSWRGGFVLKADGVYDGRLTTGVAEWEVGTLTMMKSIGRDNGVWGTGDQWQVSGTGIYDAKPEVWRKAVVVRDPAGCEGPRTGGIRTAGWMLFPTQLPDQTETCITPGRIRAVTDRAAFRRRHVYTADETNRTEELDALLQGRPVTIPAHTRLQAAWDLGDYFCAYPELQTSGGSGARVAWCWTESSRNGGDGLKGDRNAIVGKSLDGYGDTFVSDGRSCGRFSTPWFRCGRWCRLDIETGDEPLTLVSASLVESRYPLESEGAFSSPQDPSLQDIRRIGERTMRMCCHEMLFDCPYYEQQMYPGDTRVQLEVISALTRDDRIIRRAIELFALSTRDDGMVAFNFPTRGTQEGASYTLCYLCMYGDYVMNHADCGWLRARLPAMRMSLSGLECYENADGLLEDLPGWNFVDWVTEWGPNGMPPGACVGEGPNAELNLFWVLAMRSAEIVERALGNGCQADYWEVKRKRLAERIVERFWDVERELLSDTPAGRDFSEHAQCLALLGDVLPAGKSERAWSHLVADADLRRTTVYFSYYLFSCYFKFGRGDLFLKRLDLWRGYVAKGLCTTQEEPDKEKDGRKVESRSDCHAWGGHPVLFMQTGLAGIRSDAPFFGRVRIAPSPGDLREVHVRHPHPKGFITMDMRFVGGKAVGTVRTPVPGTFVWQGNETELHVGENMIQ